MTGTIHVTVRAQFSPPPPVFRPHFFLIKTPLIFISFNFLSHHQLPYIPPAYRSSVGLHCSPSRAPGPLHSHPGMSHPLCEHLQLSLCSLQVPWIDTRSPARLPEWCGVVPQAQSHRAQQSAGWRGLLACSPTAAGPAPWVQVWRPPPLLSPLICFTTHWHVVTCIGVLCGAAFR